MSKRIIHLNLMREFFDAIARGEKHQEYRDRTVYWKARLKGREYDVIRILQWLRPQCA